MEEKPAMFLGASRQLFEIAGILRRNMTVPEISLWNKLKAFKQFGFKFRRQHPIGDFVADFYCHAAKLIIEIDGKDHRTAEKIETDRLRADFFKDHGIKVIRFQNEDIIINTDQVLQIIRNELRIPTDQTLHP